MLISILIPTYNSENYILKCLNSLPKTKDLEILIVDDGSTDNTVNIINSIQDKRIRLLQNQINLGIGLTRNILLDNAQGDYIFFLDSDDYIFTDIFTNILNKLTTDYAEYDAVKPQCIDLTGKIWHPYVYRGCFIRRSFIGNTRHMNMKWAEDTVFRFLLNMKKPKIALPEEIVYFYNYPRKGSLTDIYNKKPSKI